MNEFTALLSALELTGGERIVLRSDQLPQLVVGDSRHDLGTGTVSTTTALEKLADRILSSAGRQALADQRVAVESLNEQKGIPVRVTVRRIGPQISVELQRDAQSAGSADVSAGPEKPAPPDSAARSTTTSVPGAAHSVRRADQPPAGPVTEIAQPVRPPFGHLGVGTPAPLRLAVETSTRAHDVDAIDDVIRHAVQRKASAVYLRGGRVPVARIGSRMVTLSTNPLPTAVVDAVTAGSAARVGQRAVSSSVWVREHEGVRQRWRSFTDNAGAGLVIELAWRSSEATLERDLPRYVKRICQEDDGIVVVGASSTAGLLDMISAVASWTASRRAGYVVSIEPPGGLEHEITGAFVSPRRIDPGDSGGAETIRRASHESPDVLVVARTSGAGAEEALRAARSGCLLILGVVAHTATRALESLLTHVSPQRETEMREALAAWFRCAFSYRALHTPDGRTTVVHDLLIGTPDVRARIERGDLGALENFQRSAVDGMRSLDQALARAAGRGGISLRQAASHAVDRQEVVKMIRQSARQRYVR